MNAPDPQAEQLARDAMRDAMSETLGEMLETEHLDTLAPELLTALRSRLGGYLIDPVLAGMNYTSPIEGTEATREIYLSLADADADNMLVQTYDGVEWTTLDE